MRSCTNYLDALKLQRNYDTCIVVARGKSTNMKSRLSLALGLISTLSFSANVTIDSELFVRDPQKKYLPIFLSDPSVIVDHVNAEGYELYGSQFLPQMLRTTGIAYRELNEPGLTQLWSYPSFEEVQAELIEVQKAHPEIMQLFSIGKSVRGRDLWVMKISDNVQQDEIEPEFKYISSMHGDEITGRELMLRFIRDLGESYERGDREVSWLVNNTEIYIMPSMNPDGSTDMRRGNGANRDLNRNFPELSESTPDPEAASEPETKAVMKWQSERQFALSANFHGGAEVVNYPWDAVVERHPLDRMVYDFSIDYAKNAPYIYASESFKNGVTNGFDWYQVLGGMQDWSYRVYNDLQVTIELSDVKWPDYSKIDYYYQQNRPALLNFISKIHQGGGFTLGKAGLDGQVRVISALGQEIGNFNFRNSEFYKVLVPGDYRFQIHVPSENLNLSMDVSVPASSTPF
jgi:hypothetical protein